MTIWLPDSDKVAHSINAAVVGCWKYFACINHSNLYYLMKVFQIRQNLKSGPVLARAGYQPDLSKKAGFRPEPEPNSGTALLSAPILLGYCCWCGWRLHCNQEVVNAMKNTFHMGCFLCCQCHQPIGTGSFHNEDGKIYCPKGKCRDPSNPLWCHLVGMRRWYENEA